MITVYGRRTSANVQLVVWTLEEIGLAYERLDYGHVHGGTDTPEYLAMNPMGLVPCLRDGDMVMFESAAIHRYLCARYASAPFWPDDPAVRAPLDAWAEWVKSAFMPALLNGLFYPLIRMDPAEVTPQMIAAGEAAIAPLARMLDARLGQVQRQGPWLAGADFTFADILTGHGLYRYFDMPFTRPDLPNLAAYYDRLRSRPAYAEHVCVPYDSLKFNAEV